MFGYAASGSSCDFGLKPGAVAALYPKDVASSQDSFRPYKS
jgi:hypothetical protein